MLTIENCYRRLGGDCEEVRSRIPGDALIRRFIGAFLKDPSYGELCRAMDSGNRAEAFRAAHTLKGVCANLGLGTLHASAGALTEVLRPEADVIPQEALPLAEAVRRDYRSTVETISEFLAAQ